MIIKKTAELHFNKNDIYILENSNDTIVVNNNNQGLLLLDQTLQVQKQLTISLEAPIHFVYKKYGNSALMLYLPDAHQLLFIDLETSNNFITTLPKSFYKEVLSPNYYWDKDVLILTTYDNNFYQLDFTSKTLQQISDDIAKNNSPSFFAFWNLCKQYNIVTFYPDEQSFIFQQNENSLGFFNYQQKNKSIITMFTSGWHNVECKNNLFIVIDEDKIELLQDNHKQLLHPHANSIFLKAKFLDNNHFVVLSSNPSNYQESILETYTIMKH